MKGKKMRVTKKIVPRKLGWARDETHPTRATNKKYKEIK
jgi:hypothetical protein